MTEPAQGENISATGESPGTSPRGKLFLGLPFWGHRPWAGGFYRPKVKHKDHLSEYAGVFNTVEGNTTFYSLPSAESVERWRSATPESFRFSFKLPRQITHELQLVDAAGPLATFLDRVRPLGPRLGTFLIQLPPYFGPGRFGDLDRFLAGCPSELRFAVEVRHLGWFDEHPMSRRLDEMLTHYGAERCWMDTRPLRSGLPSSSAVREALRKKPDVPVRVPASKTALSDRPMIRFIAHPEPETTDPWIERWIGVLARWIEQGRSPYFMVHLPDNTLVPQLAARIHQMLSRKVDLEPLAPFPVDLPDESDRQLSLL